MEAGSKIDVEFTAWLNPIKDDNPCGEDMSLELSYETIKAEVDKDLSIYAEQVTDWKRVLADSTSFLTTESKDLWILCYAVKAVYEVYGLSRAATACKAAKEFIEKYWENLYPSIKRPARRVAPLVWLCGRLEAIVTHEGFPGDQGKAADSLRNALIDLGNFLTGHLPEAEPYVLSLIKNIPELKEEPKPSQQIEEDSQFKASESQPAAPPPEMALSPVHQASDNETSGEAAIPPTLLPQAYRNVMDNARRLAQHYLYHNPTDWRAYLLHRAVLWSCVSQVPPSDAEGRTQLRPVPKERALMYHTGVETGHFGDILPALESSASKMPFWFDGHYMVAKCLKALRANMALSILTSSLIAFVDQHPNLLTLKYFDDTPFASLATRSWLETLEDEQARGAGASPVKIKSDIDENNEEELLCEAMVTFNDQGFEAGLAQLGMPPAARSRSSLRRGLIVARYCLMAGQPDAGACLLQELYGRLEEWGLLDWEPDLTADILSLLVIAAGRQGLALSEAQIRRLYWLRLPSALAVFKQ